MCMSGLFPCTSVHHMHEVSVEVRREHQIPGGSGVTESHPVDAGNQIQVLCTSERTKLPSQLSWTLLIAAFLMQLFVCVACMYMCMCLPARVRNNLWEMVFFYYHGNARE